MIRKFFRKYFRKIHRTHKATNSANSDFNAIFTIEHTSQFFQSEPLFVFALQGQNVSFKHFVLFGAIGFSGRKMLVISAAIYSENSAQSFYFVLKTQEMNSD